jgi:hypothetical protein
MSVTLFIQHAMLMRRTILSSVAGPARLPQYPINGTIFEIKVFEHKMCVLIFSKNFV